ncbi:MAG: hypothetical protein JJU29_09725 [Verrucomicrobia bacterium]|nr:hypothetical protein [Verrucomicrobiota bacterium]MCH8511529.1 hypothetical protein [Kiritimatiellia bacterium]
MKYIKIIFYLPFVFGLFVSCANKNTVPDVNGIWIVDKELALEYFEGNATLMEGGAHEILMNSENRPDKALQRDDSYSVAKIISGKWMTRIYFEDGEYYTGAFRIERIPEEDLRHVTSLKGLSYYAFEIMGYDRINNQYRYLSRKDFFPQKRDNIRASGLFPRSRILIFDKFNEKNIVAVYHLYHENYDYVDKFWFVDFWVPLDFHEEFILNKLSMEKLEAAREEVNPEM